MMLPVVTKISVERRDFIRYDRENPRGSGYCAEQWTEQRLVKRWNLFGVCVWKKVLDSERVPAWAVIQEGCLGGTDWRSKFVAYL